MKSIKYKAWDKEKGEWFRSTNPNDKNIEISDAVLNANVLNLMASAPMDCLMKRYEFLQYTGLKDKNGKDVWEGDIVLVGKEKQLRIVTWSEEDAGFRYDKPFYPVDADRTITCYEASYIRGTEVEVIGNIYQGNHLLN